MIERPGTWGEVTAGTTLLTPTDNPIVIIKTAPDRQGRIWYLAQNHLRRELKISPKPSEAPVTILECTPEEAELVALNGLPAHRLLDAERDRRMPERARQWIVPPLPTKGRGATDKARDHIDWYHGAYSGEAAVSGGFKTLKELLAAHEEMHAAHFMDKPHTHEGEGALPMAHDRQHKKGVGV